MNGPNNPIGWTDFTANSVSGKCLHNCLDCYAERIRVRYNKSEEIVYRSDWFSAGQVKRFIAKEGRSPRIFVGSMHDLFGDWVKSDWIQGVINVCADNPEAIFIFLTQNPKRYPDFDFPDNCWLGTTCRTQEEASERLPKLARANAAIKFVSFEPLNTGIDFTHTLSPYLGCSIHWTIAGCKTPYHRNFNYHWVKDLIDISNIFNTPVYVKQLTNLPGFPQNGKADDDMNHWPEWARKREFPKCEKPG